MDTTSVTGEIKRETERAVLFFDGKIECWIPKSQICSMAKYSDSVEIEIPVWLAEDKGLE